MSKTSKNQIVQAATAILFAANLPEFQNKTLTGTQFRRKVMDTLQADHGVSISSAATHYNIAFQAVKKADPASVAGLGGGQNTVLSGQKKIATTGTAVQLGSGALVNGVIITANINNVAPISVGPVGVNNTQDGTGICTIM